MKTLRTIRWEGIILVILIILLALGVLIQANPGNKTPARDSGIFIYIGNEILHGKLPYRDAWDNKPPAIFYLDALALWIGRGTRWGIWFIEMLSLMLALYLSYRLMKDLWGTWPAVFGLLLWAYELDTTLLGGNLTEEYPLPLHFLSLILFLQLLKNPANKLFNFLIGTLFAIVFLFRPNNAIVETAIVIALMAAQIGQKDYRNLFSHLLWMGIGAILPLGLTLLYFWSQGDVQGLIDASILYNITYGTTRFTTSSPLTFGFALLRASAWIMLVGYLIALFETLHTRENRFFHLFLLIGFPMAIYLSDPAQRNYVHYYMNWLPFMALLGGLAFHFFQSRLLPKINNFPILSATALLLAVVIVVARWGNRVSDYKRAIGHMQDWQEFGLQATTPISKYVDYHTKPGDYVLFWGEYPGENYMSNRETPSPVLFYPLQVPSSITEKLDDQFLHDIEEKKPAMIVDMAGFTNFSLDPKVRQSPSDPEDEWPYPPDNLDKVLTFISQNYVFNGNAKGMNVYVLK